MTGNKQVFGDTEDAKFSGLRLALDLADSVHPLAKPLLKEMMKKDAWLAKKLCVYGVAF